MSDDGGRLVEWLALAEEAARRHRHGRVLGTDPALVLRGVPAVWRPATERAGPADDVIALAGAALARLPTDASPTLRQPLVDAAAECTGSDLPALLRRIGPSVTEAAAAAEAEGADTADDTDATEADRVAAPPGAGRHGPVAGRGGRLSAVGMAATVVLAAMGLVTSWSPAPEPGRALGPSPVTVAAGDGVLVASWAAPHLVLEVDGLRYRYRLEGAVDAVLVRPGSGEPVLVATAGGRSWTLEVPALADA